MLSDQLYGNKTKNIVRLYDLYSASRIYNHILHHL